MSRARGAVALACVLLLGCGGEPGRRPNVVLIVADDLGWADLGVQGSPDVATPQIDSIARDGVRFTAAYASAPQCAPSRAGLMTGRYQNRFGFEYNFRGKSWDAGLDPAERTLADRMRDAGYATGMIGKWHLGKTEPLRPDRRGFDEAFWHPNGGFYLPRGGSLPGIHRGAEPVSVSQYSTDAFTDEAIAFVERHREQPFFLYLAYVTPHVPMEAEPERLAHVSHVPDLQRRTLLAMMQSLDDNVGRLLDAVRRAGLEEDTLVFFLSDNGGVPGRPRASPDAPFEPGTNASSNLPFRGQKRDLLEGGIRVPFLVKWPAGLPAGVVYDEPVITLDVLPTMLATAGVAAPADVDGVDLLPFLRGERRGAPHDALFWRFDFTPIGDPPRRWAVREGRWKLVKNAKEPLALYDLAEDPGETRNLVGREPARARDLEARWKRWNAAMRPPAWPAEPVE